MAPTACPRMPVSPRHICRVHSPEILPLLAHLAQHAKLPPGIGTVTNLSGSTFADGGFDTSEQDSSARLVFIIDKSGSMWAVS